jgi:FixJ family two-component response regulator
MSEQTVVLVDDNDAFRKSTTWLLKTAGFTVDEFDNAASALHALKHQRRNGGTCLLSDVRMPEMNGLQLHEEVKKAAIDVPVVFMTGHGDIPLAVDAMRNGAVTKSIPRRAVASNHSRRGSARCSIWLSPANPTRSLPGSWISASRP